MKRRILNYDKRGVSNVIAYFFSFSIATMVMVSSVYITNGIIEDKTAQIASLQAQSVANKVAYGVVEAIVSRQSNPGLNYTKTLDTPLDLAGLSYYIEITDTAVYVNTSRQVSKSCSIYNAEELNIGLTNDRIYSGSGKINIYYEEPDYVYKFDFGKGNNVSHSPVESGYYMVTEQDQEWHNGYDSYLYRIPINVSNPSSENLTDVPVKIVLNTGNFDYSHASVTYTNDSRSEVSSDLVFRNDTDTKSYYIDHWNPEGESVILMNMTLENYSYEHIYLYYGYTESLEDEHKHNIGDVSMFFDDFNNDLSKWNILSGNPNVNNGNLTLQQNDCIESNFEIPLIDTPNPLDNATNVSAAMYIVEAKMKIDNNTCCRMVLLNQISSASYQILAWCNSSSKLLLEKCQTSPPTYQELQNVTVPHLNHSLRWKSYVYHSKTCYHVQGDNSYFTNATYITSNIYDFGTFAFQGNISGLDTYPSFAGDDAIGAPILSWTILLANIDDFTPYTTGDIVVDWIRVMKAPPVPLTVSIGPMESKKYKWSGPVNAGIKYNSSNPFDPGPVLCDFNYGTSATFTIESLPEDDYTITVTMGKYDDTCNETIIQFEGGSYGTLTIPATENGKFETKWHSINWPGGNLELKFSSTDANTWTVNSIVVERGEKGIKVTGG